MGPPRPSQAGPVRRHRNLPEGRRSPRANSVGTPSPLMPLGYAAPSREPIIEQRAGSVENPRAAPLPQPRSDPLAPQLAAPVAHRPGRSQTPSLDPAFGTLPCRGSGREASTLPHPHPEPRLPRPSRARPITRRWDMAVATRKLPTRANLPPPVARTACAPSRGGKAVRATTGRERWGSAYEDGRLPSRRNARSSRVVGHIQPG